MSVRPAHFRASSLLISSNFTLKSPFVCRPCLRKLSRLTAPTPRRPATSAGIAIATNRAAYNSTLAVNQGNANGVVQKNYFFANQQWDRTAKHNQDRAMEQDSSPKDTSTDPSSETAVPQSKANLPHRRRRRSVTSIQEDESKSGVHELPLDASSQLSTMSSNMPKNSFRQRFLTYLSLSKPRLGFLIVLTTATAYSLFPVAISPMSSAMDLSPLTLLNLTAGTALSVASANALNMLLEPAYDAKMTRTRTRPLVRGLITRRAALLFAAITGAAGVGLLYTGVNPTVSFLSALNIFLYAGVYTPLKRLSVLNTWAGAIVGGIPPLMGWAAAAGQQAPGAGWRELLFDPVTSPGGWLLAGLLFAWQFPHFNALSYPIRHEYAAAGYKMLVSVNVRKTALIALRYALVMFPLCAGLSAVGVTSWAFVGTSGVVNAWMAREAWRFYRLEGAKASARGLFWASVWHLPLVLVLAMVHKNGLWERFVNGGLAQDEMYEYYYLEQPTASEEEKEDAQKKLDG